MFAHIIATAKSIATPVRVAANSRSGVTCVNQFPPRVRCREVTRLMSTDAYKTGVDQPVPSHQRSQVLSGDLAAAIPAQACLRPANQREDHQLMQNRLRAALGNNRRSADHTLSSFQIDMHATLSYLGLNASQAQETGRHIICALLQDKPLAEIEREILRYLRCIIVDAASGQNMIDAIEPKLEGRAELIFNQLQPYLTRHQGQRILDFGAGDGAVTQLIHDRISSDTRGIDVRPYPKPGLTVPLSVYAAGVVPYPDASFDCIVSTNVLHHAADNQQCVSEFKRLLRPGASAVIIETVPLGDTEEEALRNWELTFLNDYLYNRLFHDADVPVPGTFETFQGWIRRFTQAGFMVKATEDFGIDQQIIRDRHVLLHIEKL